MNQELLKKVAEIAAKQVITSNQKKNDPKKEIISQIPNSNVPMPEKSKKSLFSGVGGILKDLAPVAASFIPGVGPIASSLLSTLNDDSWFEEYKSAGASFNEKLVTRTDVKVKSGSGSNQVLEISVIPRAAFATFVTIPRFDYGVKDTVGSSLVAFIRSKTNNVLTDNIDSYYEAVDAALKLYAYHYSMEKWLKFAQKQPLNIPLPTSLIKVLAPENLNLLMGISASLKQYLQATIKLPYPVVEAVRWRFGTLFHSFNTGQPGYITYDPINFMEHTAENTFRALNHEVNRLKQVILNAGRASADIKLAYENHINRLDVEDSHYDEKEFNLRHNIVDSFKQLDNFSLIKDSRLATSPAIQALTLSTHTTGEYELFPVYPTSTITINDDIDFDSGTSLAFYNIFTKAPDVTSTSLGRPDAQTSLISVLQASGWINLPFYGYASAGDLSLQIDNNTGPTAYKVHEPDNETNRYKIGGLYRSQLINALTRSLGIYKVKNMLDQTLYATGTTNVNTRMVMDLDHISYDMAIVSKETIEAIQTAALRNLFRGSMAGPKAEVTTAEVKPQIEKILDSVTP